MKRAEKNTGKIGLLLILSLGCAIFAVCMLWSGNKYKKTENWAYLPDEITKSADCFLVCPTVYGGDENQYNMKLTDKETKEKFVGALNMERGIYEDSCNMYAPFYRQMSLSGYELTDAKQQEKYMQYAYKDVKESFEYYMKNYNDDRPVVLAGFSQGANMILRLLEEYYADSTYQDKLVAAYVIGNAVTKEDLAAYPHLKMAEAAADTGCIISFNSESPESDYSILVPDTTLGINPLNWKTDSTEAPAELNKGACFTNYAGEITREIPGLCGAYLDEERGTLKVTGVTPEDYPPVLSIFDSGIYHLYDYQFFYRNLQENVALRVEQFQTLAFLEKNYRATGIEENEWLTDDLDNKEAMYLSLVENVTPKMMEADFWTAMVPNPTQEIMTKQQIEDFNEKAGNHKKGFFYYAADEFPGTVSADELNEILTAMSYPEGERYLDGKLVGQEYWNQLVEIENMDGILEENPVRYGFAVDRTDIRVMPTKDAISDAPEFLFYDDMQNSVMLLNEPVTIMHTSIDGNWYYILTRFCGGWVPVQNIAICKSKEEWQTAQSEEAFLLVTGNKITLDYDPVQQAASERMLTMGTKLMLVKPEEFPKSEEGRCAADVYVVKLPTRQESGELAYEYAYVPKGMDVRIGYLPYTRANLLKQAFKCNGDRYGWGGMYHARDCSELLMEIYQCMGIELGRNSGTQAATKCKTIHLAGMSEDTKKELLHAVPAGSILYFPGHIMMYLGEVDNRFYTISATGSMRSENAATDEVVPYQSVMVNDLSAIRKNGNTWLASMEKCKIIWETE